MPAAFSGWFSVTHTHTHTKMFAIFALGFLSYRPLTIFVSQLLLSHVFTCLLAACVSVCVWGILIIQTSSMCSDSDVNCDVASSSSYSYFLYLRDASFYVQQLSYLVFFFFFVVFLFATLLVVVVFVVASLEVFHFIHCERRHRFYCLKSSSSNVTFIFIILLLLLLWFLLLWFVVCDLWSKWYGWCRSLSTR